MRRPLGLSAYLTLTGVARPDPARLREVRALRSTVWLHPGRTAQPAAVQSFCARLLMQRDDLDLVVTADRSRFPQVPGAQVVPIPQETPSSVAAFLDTHAPMVGLWFGNDLRPALMHSAVQTGCRMMALDLQDLAFDLPSFRWMADSVALVLDDCDEIVTQDLPALQRLRRLGIRRAQMHALGKLPHNPVPLPAAPEQLARVAELVGGRSVWLASQVQAEELHTVLRAHRTASRYAHRLLLVLVPAPECPAEEVERALGQSGLRYRTSAPDTPQDPLVQVLCCDRSEDLGAWHRVSPLAFLGGSLRPGGKGTDPAQAAALGSAILYGPNVASHAEIYARLVAGGAARLVRDTDGLATAVTAALAPDMAAAMSSAAWDIMSQRADLVDWLLDRVCDAVELGEAA